MTPLLRAFVVGTVLALALAACGEPVTEPDPLDDPADDPAPDPVDTPEDDPAEEVDAAGAALVAVASTDLGEVLVDGDGMTLYMFDRDEQSDSVCYDDCAQSWPPLLTDADPQVSDGADAALLGTTERDDGSTQVTYDGWPLYHWAGDSVPGDTNGYAVGDMWWVLTADGTPVREDGGDAAAGAVDDDGY